EAAARRTAPGRRAPGAGRRFAMASGWLAAAAGWALVWLGGVPQPTPEPAPAPTVAERLASLETRAADLVRVDWSAGGDETGGTAQGDVVWSDALQEGYMRFEGLAVNDPTKEQYQLWIFDAARDAAHPVDGGVFDVAEGGEVIVPIRAHLPVDEATLFAVTVERPGGVVVSSRERIAVLAQVGG
nr:anti-sigma factor [Myxococcota bacterium]